MEDIHKGSSETTLRLQIWEYSASIKLAETLTYWRAWCWSYWFRDSYYKRL